MSGVHYPGEVLVRGPGEVSWVAYGLDDGELCAACYLAGGLIQHGPAGYFRVGPHGAIPLRARDLRAVAAVPPPEGLPVLPGQEELVPGAPAGARLFQQLASAVKVVPPVWLWPRWLVADAVQLLVGRQGSGKSTFAAWAVAELSTGRPWPGETERRLPVTCGMLSLEEPAERLAARLVAAGADLDRVHLLGHVEDHDDEGRPYRRPWRLPGDCAVLEQAIAELGLAAVTIDGLGYSVSGDSHNYANVGSALSALAAVAERSGCAIVGLTHPPKGNADAVTAAIGSTAWTAVSRITWVMGGDPTDDSGARRVVRPAPGSNYRLPDHGLSFTIGNHDETEAGFVANLKESDVDPQAITAPPVPETDEDRTARDDAVEFLRSYLAGGLEQKAAEVTRAARAESISDRTLARARKDVGVQIRRDGFGRGSVVWWSLTYLPPDPHSCQPPNAGNYDLHVASMGEPDDVDGWHGDDPEGER